MDLETVIALRMHAAYYNLNIGICSFAGIRVFSQPCTISGPYLYINPAALTFLALSGKVRYCPAYFCLTVLASISAATRFWRPGILTAAPCLACYGKITRGVKIIGALSLL